MEEENMQKFNFKTLDSKTLESIKNSELAQIEGRNMHL
jgi:hypothetical protein